MANQARFRTAIFGGYNCSDVIDFIKEESKRNRQELAQKDARIAELEEKFAASARDLAEEKAKARPDLEEALRVKETVMDGLLAENASLKSRLAELEQRFDELSRSCEAIAEEKQYLVDLEIDARKRADAVEKASAERVEAMAGEVRARMQGAAERINAFGADADAKVGDVLAHLAEYAETLRGLSAAFADTRREVLDSVESFAALPEAAAGEAPDGEIPAEAASVDDAPVEDTPADETPAGDAPEAAPEEAAGTGSEGPETAPEAIPEEKPEIE